MMDDFGNALSTYYPIKIIGQLVVSLCNPYGAHCDPYWPILEDIA